MLDFEEVIRIISAILFMLAGVFLFRFGYKITTSQSPYKLLSFKALALNEDEKIKRYNAILARSIYTLALIGLGNGALLAYIPDMIISISIVAVLSIIGVLYVLYQVHKAKQECK